MSILLKRDEYSYRSIILNEYALVLNEVVEDPEDGEKDYIQMGVRYEELDTFIFILSAISNCKRLNISLEGIQLYSIGRYILMHVEGNYYKVLGYTSVCHNNSALWTVGETVEFLDDEIKHRKVFPPEPKEVPE